MTTKMRLYTHGSNDGLATVNDGTAIGCIARSIFPKEISETSLVSVTKPSRKT